MNIFWIIYWIAVCFGIIHATILTRHELQDGASYTLNDLLLCTILIMVPVLNLITVIVTTCQLLSIFGSMVIFKGK